MNPAHLSISQQKIGASFLPHLISLLDLCHSPLLSHLSLNAPFESQHLIPSLLLYFTPILSIEQCLLSVSLPPLELLLFRLLFCSTLAPSHPNHFFVDLLFRYPCVSTAIREYDAKLLLAHHLARVSQVGTKCVVREGFKSPDTRVAQVGFLLLTAFFPSSYIPILSPDWFLSMVGGVLRRQYWRQLHDMYALSTSTYHYRV